MQPTRHQQLMKFGCCLSPLLDFYDLKQLLDGKTPALSNRLKGVMDSLNELPPDSSREKLSPPITKLGHFLRTIGDEGSDRHKLLKGISNGLETAKKVAKTYNKFAQWVPGLPVVPEILLKD